MNSRFFFLVLAVVLLLSGCATLNRSFQVDVKPPIPLASESVDNYLGFFYPDDRNAFCSVKVGLSTPAKLGLVGFQSRRTHTDTGEYIFVPPSRITRVMVVKNDNSVTLFAGVVDEFLQSVWVNLPQEWCQEDLQAVVVGNDGTWVQTTDKKVFGTLDVLWNSRALNDSIDVGSLLKKDYRKGFLIKHPSLVNIIPIPVRLTPEEKQFMDAMAKVVAKETTQETAGQRIAQNTNFWVDVFAFLSPWSVPVQGALWGISAYDEAFNGKPHGFRTDRAITAYEVLENVNYFHLVGEKWRKEFSQKAGKPFKERKLDPEALKILHQGGGDWVDSRTAMTILERVIDSERQAVQSVLSH